MEKQKNWELLEKLFRYKTTDRRRSQWMCFLGSIYNDSSMSFPRSTGCYDTSGKLGLGEAYARLAHVYIKKRDWATAKVYDRKAADLQHVVAIYCLAVEVHEGRFVFGGDL